EQARNAVVRAQPHKVRWTHGVHPLAVVADRSALDVEDPSYLIHVGLRIASHFVLRECRPGLLLARGIPNAGRKVPDQEDRQMAELLEIPTLFQHHRVSEMEIRGRRIHAELDAQGT